jgi:hypothetical protein
MKTTKLPCCGYEVTEGHAGPILWNPYNKVVQCHACGAIYNLTPRMAYSQDSVKTSVSKGTLHSELTKVLNTFNAENGSNTPDFLLADYLVGCLQTYNVIVTKREKWHGRGEEEFPPRVRDESAEDDPDYEKGLPQHCKEMNKLYTETLCERVLDLS